MKYLLLLALLLSPVSAFAITDSGMKDYKESIKNIRTFKCFDFSNFDDVYINKWIAACENNKTKKNKWPGVKENKVIEKSSGVYCCDIKECDDGFLPDVDGGCSKPGAPCKQKPDVDAKVVDIQTSANNIKIGDTYDFSLYEWSVDKIKNSLLVWQQKCHEIPVTNGKTDSYIRSLFPEDVVEACSPVYRLECHVYCDDGYEEEDKQCNAIDYETPTRQMIQDAEAIINACDNALKRLNKDKNNVQN